MSCGHDDCTCTHAPAPTGNELPQAQQAQQGEHAGAGGCCGGRGHQHEESSGR